MSLCVSGIGLNPCENPSLNPCTGEAGYQCWYEVCGDDDSTLCNISCRQDDMASITGVVVDLPIDSTEASGNDSVVPGNNVGGGSTIPGIDQMPSMVDPTDGDPEDVDLVPSNNTGGSNACPDGSAPVNCLFDPCIATSCLVGTQCVPIYCGGRCLVSTANSLKAGLRFSTRAHTP